MTMREKMARAMCDREGVNPDQMGYGQGVIMMKDKPYRLWEARLHLVDAALDALMEPTAEIIDDGAEIVFTLESSAASCEEMAIMIFKSIIQGTKAGK